MDYNCAKQVAYSIKKTAKKTLLSKTMSTYISRYMTKICAKHVAKSGWVLMSQWLYLDILDSDGCDNAPESEVQLDRKLNDFSSKFWTLMGVTMPKGLTILLDRKLNDYTSNFWSLMGGRGIDWVKDHTSIFWTLRRVLIDYISIFWTLMRVLIDETSIFWTLMGVTMPQTLTVSRVERSNSRNVFSMSMSGLHPIRIFKNIVSYMKQKT